MALIQATSSFDIDNINLYRTTSLSSKWIFPSSGTPVHFQDNGMQTYGYWFDDALDVLYDYAGSSYGLALGGNSLTWNGSNLTGGTVVAMVELSINSSGVEQTLWYARDFSLSAASFSAARLTSSTADDYTLVQAMLSGGDQMLGSTSNDRLRGYGGSDSIDGAGGSDTAIYSGKFSDYSFSFNKSTLATTITSPVFNKLKRVFIPISIVYTFIGQRPKRLICDWKSACAQSYLLLARRATRSSRF
jgi:Ca2+-binding RTX toxin-like protein